MALTKATEKSISDNLSISGIATATNFKTGTTNVHNVGVEAAGINVLGADTPIGSGSTIYDDGGARFSGIVTATDFSGQSGGAADFPNGLTGTTGTFSGAVSAASATITGNLGVGGVVTYEDVTNIDSVGVITARSGINLVGNDLNVGSNIKLGNASGIVTATSFSGSGASLTALNGSNIASGTVPTARLGSGTANNTTFLRGDSTFQTVNTDLVSDTSPQLGGNLDANSKNILFGDTSGSSNNRLKFGAGPDLEISHNGTDSIIQDAGTGDLKIGGSIVRLTNAAISENMLVATENGAVELYHDDVSMLETESRGAFVRKENGGDTTFTIGSTNASGVRLCLDGDSNGDAFGNDYAYLQHNTDGHLIIAADNPAQNGQIIFASGNAAQRAKFNASGHFLPVSNNTYDLGTSSERWRNIYTNDLNLSNEGNTNDVDGTWGNYTIQEGESDLFLINNRNGKKYKFNLMEVS